MRHRAVLSAVLLTAVGWSAEAGFPSVDLAADRTYTILPDSAVIDDTHVCRECSISLLRRVVVGQMDDDDTPSAFPFGLVELRGPRYATISQNRDQVLYYDGAGRLSASVGRSGSGPGEFEGINFMAVPFGNDSILVADAQRRLSLVHHDDVGLFFDWPVPPIREVVALDAHRFVVAADFRHPSHAGAPLHVIGPSGLSISFGATPPVVDQERPSLTRRLIARRDSATVWSIRPDLYSMEALDTAGRVVRRRDRHVAWFPVRSFEQSPPGRRGQPFVRDIKVGVDGEIWVLIQISDPRWNQRASNGAVVWKEFDTTFNSVVEILSPDADSVRMRQELDHYLDGFVGENGVFRRAETDDGLFVFEVFDLAVSRGTS